MPQVTHRRGTHRYVLTYGSEADLGAICAAIVELGEQPELDFDAADALAISVAVANLMAREALQRAARDVLIKPPISGDEVELPPCLNPSTGALGGAAVGGRHNQLAHRRLTDQ